MLRRAIFVQKYAQCSTAEKQRKYRNGLDGRQVWPLDSSYSDTNKNKGITWEKGIGRSQEVHPWNKIIFAKVT